MLELKDVSETLSVDSFVMLHECMLQQQDVSACKTLAVSICDSYNPFVIRVKIKKTIRCRKYLHSSVRLNSHCLVFTVALNFYAAMLLMILWHAVFGLSLHLSVRISMFNQTLTF